jgi:hypothetical protein
MPRISALYLKPSDSCFVWRAKSENENYLVGEFESAPLFNGKIFRQVEKDIEWVD